MLPSDPPEALRKSADALLSALHAHPSLREGHGQGQASKHEEHKGLGITLTGAMGRVRPVLDERGLVASNDDVIDVRAAVCQSKAVAPGSRPTWARMKGPADEVGHELEEDRQALRG